jgi:glycosyltransferase involved in cell wall biosynthesis
MDRHGFLFVGAIHEEISPNGDSLVWFLEEIFPRIRAELRETRFTIAGINRSERIRRLAGEQVTITGHVEDLGPLYNQARVFVAPTRYAAGIPHKVHEAAARGLPVVATPLLAEQLGWESGSSLLAAGDAEAFAKHCIELHSDGALWSRLRERGLNNISRECSVKVFETRLKEITSVKRTRFADVGMDR